MPRTKQRKRIALYLDVPQLQRLQTISHEVGIPVSEQIRRAIDAYLKAQKGGRQ